MSSLQLQPLASLMLRLFYALLVFAIFESLTRFFMFWGIFPYVVFWQADVAALLLLMTTFAVVPALWSRGPWRHRRGLIILTVLLSFVAPFIAGRLLESTIRTQIALRDVPMFPGSRITDVRYSRRPEAFGLEASIVITYSLPDANTRLDEITEFYRKELRQAGWKDWEDQCLLAKQEVIGLKCQYYDKQEYTRDLGESVRTPSPTTSGNTFTVSRGFSNGAFF